MAAIKIGLIGAGGISNAHVHGYLALREEAVVAAVADSDASACARQAERCGGARAYTDYRDLLADPDIVAVDICLPHHLHAPVALAAIAASKHVLVEKPIATNLADAQAMVRAARNAGLILMVGHNERYDPQYTLIKAIVDSGELGDVLCVRADHNQNFWRPKGHWLRDNAQAGGGVLIGSGIHRLDLMRWMFGEIQAVMNLHSYDPRRLEGEVAALTLLEFARPNLVGELSSVWASRHFPWYEMLWVYGTHGSVHNIGGVHVESERRAESSGGFVRLEVPQKDSFTEELRHFLACIRTGQPPLTSGEEGLKTLAVVLAAYRAQGERRWVSVADGLVED